MNKYSILSALIIGVLAFLLTSGVNRLFDSGKLGRSRWIKRGLILLLVFAVALGVKTLIA